MTVAGIALVVFASVLILSLSRGLARRVGDTGEAENLLVISKKGQNIMFSSVEEDSVVHLASLPGVAHGLDGRPLVSPELMHVSYVEGRAGDKQSRSPVQIRGVQPVAWEVHRDIRVTDGRLPEGPFELLAGCSAHVKLGLPPESMAGGKTIRFDNRDWTISGRFEAGGSIVESEVWAHEADLQTVLRRRSHTFAVVRLESPEAMDEALRQFHQPTPVEALFTAWSEPDYYAEFTQILDWIFWLSLFMVGAIAVAGALAGINTMYTAIINRMGEIATLRVLGFARRDILASLTLESLALSLTGGALGVAAGFLIHGLPMRMSQGAFYLVVDGPVLAAALGLALFIGLAGALLPSFRGLRLTIVQAFRGE
jgi:putative ABC transport system permease protein